MKIAITGIPRSGKTTLAQEFKSQVLHTDDTKDLDWSEQSDEVCTWFDDTEDFVIEGVVVPRALRKWLDKFDGKPCDVLIWLSESHEDLSEDQKNMADGIDTIMAEIVPDLEDRGVLVLG